MQSKNDAFYKSQIKEKILNILYLEPKQDLINEIREIVKKNLKIQNIYPQIHKDYYIYFRGQRWFNNNYPIPVNSYSTIYVDLDKSFTKEMLILTDELNLLDDEEKIIASFLNQLLNNLNTLKDILHFIPKQLHKEIPYTPYTPSVLKKYQIKNLEEKYSDYIAVLNKRILTNLLANQN